MIEGMKAQGFVLQATYQIVSNSNRRRVPVVHLHGRLEDGGTFLVRDFRQRPHFYVRAADAGRVVKLGHPEPYSTNKQTFDGAPVCRLEVETPPDVPSVRGGGGFLMEDSPLPVATVGAAPIDPA